MSIFKFNSTSIKNNLYIPNLDGIRFFGFLLVFFHHSSVQSIFFFQQLNKIGWAGVDLFLTLSAYLLTTLLKAEFDKTGSIDIPAFYIRRGLRIWPLYFMFVLICFIYSMGFTSVHFRILIGRFLGLITFSDNFIAMIRGYSLVPWTGHLWTISLEEQFYFILPISLLVLFSKYSQVSKIKLLVCFLVIESLLNLIRIAAVTLLLEHPFIWTSPFRLDSIVFGVFLALGLFDQLKIKAEILMVLGGLFHFSLAWIPETIGSVGFHQAYLYFLVAVFTAMIVKGGIEDSFFSKILSSQVFRYLGKISYGLYVFHIFTIDIVEKNLKSYSLDWYYIFAISLFITIFLAIISYEFYEKYFLKLKIKYEKVLSRPI